MHEEAQHTHTHTQSLTYALAVGQSEFTMATGEQGSRMQSLAHTGVAGDSTLHVRAHKHVFTWKRDMVKSQSWTCVPLVVWFFFCLLIVRRLHEPA